MRQTWKHLATSLAVGCAVTLGACGGGGDDDGSAGPDAPTGDGDPDGFEGPTRALTISVADLAVTTPSAAAVSTRGGAISIEVEDLTTGGGEIVFGESPVGGCVVTRFDAAHPAHPTLDAGTVTIANPGVEESGLLKPVGPCDYRPDTGYLCVSTEAADQTATATPTGVSGTELYAFQDQNFARDYVGSYLVVNGFAQAGNNSGARAFPIVGQPAATTLTVVNDGGAAGTTAAASFSVINGAGPIPTAGGANADFLASEVDQIRIAKPASDEFGAIDVTVYTRGEGFDLDDASALPHQLPTSAAAVTFSCGGAGGSCGADADPTGVLEAFVISGRTTDASVEGLEDYEMPAPTGTYATFQCGFLLDESTSGTIPADAVAAILATGPTRIETRVLNVAGVQGVDGDQAFTIVVGHGVVGHTTIP